jgi:hypothetical protein
MYPGDVMLYQAMHGRNFEPKTMHEAQLGADRDLWKSAMKEQQRSLPGNKTGYPLTSLMVKRS